MRINAERLREKGWSETEIAHAQKILIKAKRRKHPHRNLLNEFIYWGTLFLAQFTIVAIAYWIIPFFFFTRSTILYPITAIMALCFGILFTHLIKDLEHLERHHHVIFAAAIPVTSLLSFFLILTNTRGLEAIIGIHHNISLTASIFTLCFIAPYLYYLRYHERR